MKKAILTFGLFSMMLVLTSFTSPEIGGGSKIPTNPNPLQREIGGGSKVPTEPAPFTAAAGQYIPQSMNQL